MAKVTIISTQVSSQDTLRLQLQYDLIQEDGSAVQAFYDIRKADWLLYKSLNPSKTLLDYVTEFVKPDYTAKQQLLQASTALLQKTIEW